MHFINNMDNISSLRIYGRIILLSNINFILHDNGYQKTPDIWLKIWQQSAAVQKTIEIGKNIRVHSYIGILQKIWKFTQTGLCWVIKSLKD